MAEIVRERQRAGARAVLGLATGSTPIGIYRELIRMHREQGSTSPTSWRSTSTSNYPMPAEQPAQLSPVHVGEPVDQVNIDRRNVHIPRGDIPRGAVEAHCRDYEARDRGGRRDRLPDPGIGQTGHIGFNEPGSSIGSRTRLVVLDTITRRTAAADFFGTENVPAEAITMGVATILEPARSP